jgi:protein required for attachment to host cells
MKPMRSWIVVVDGGQARFLQWAGKKSGAREIPGQVFTQQVPRSKELGRGRPARVQESGGPARHGVEPRTDAHAEQENTFLSDIVRQLLEAYEADAFDHLVIIAPPKALGVLRQMLPKKLADCIAFDIDKDLTGHTDSAISEVVNAHLERAMVKPIRAA